METCRLRASKRVKHDRRRFTYIYRWLCDVAIAHGANEGFEPGCRLFVTCKKSDYVGWRCGRAKPWCENRRAAKPPRNGSGRPRLPGHFLDLLKSIPELYLLGAEAALDST
jgi:hypothetical protein